MLGPISTQFQPISTTLHRFDPISADAKQIGPIASKLRPVSTKSGPIWSIEAEVDRIGADHVRAKPRPVSTKFGPIGADVETWAGLCPNFMMLPALWRRKSKTAETLFAMLYPSHPSQHRGCQKVVQKLTNNCLSTP